MIREDHSDLPTRGYCGKIKMVIVNHQTDCPWALWTQECNEIHFFRYGQFWEQLWNLSKKLKNVIGTKSPESVWIGEVTLRRKSRLIYSYNARQIRPVQYLEVVSAQNSSIFEVHSYIQLLHFSRSKDHVNRPVLPTRVKFMGHQYCRSLQGTFYSTF